MPPRGKERPPPRSQRPDDVPVYCSRFSCFPKVVFRFSPESGVREQAFVQRPGVDILIGAGWFGGVSSESPPFLSAGPSAPAATHSASAARSPVPGSVAYPPRSIRPVRIWPGHRGTGPGTPARRNSTSYPRTRLRSGPWSGSFPYHTQGLCRSVAMDAMPSSALRTGRPSPDSSRASEHA